MNKYNICDGDVTKIENYDKAVNDNTQCWVLHHRLETHFSDGVPRPVNVRLSMNELKALNMYYNRPPEELIFLTNKDHVLLHHKGKKRSEETCRKISEAQKGHVVSEEARKKMSKAREKYRQSETTKRKRSESLKRYYQNNKRSETVIEKCRESRKGYVHSEETKRKISEGNKKHWQDKKQRRV